MTAQRLAPVLLLALLSAVLLPPVPVRGHCGSGFPPPPPVDRRPAGTPGERVTTPPGSRLPMPPGWGRRPDAGETSERDDTDRPSWTRWWELNREEILSLRALRARRRLAALPEDAPEIAPESLLAALRSAAGEAHKDVATAAIIALGRARDGESLDLLVERTAAKNVHRTIRESAVLAVGMVGADTARARGCLTRILALPESGARLRAMAALGLGALGDPAALPVLFARVRDPDEDEQVACLSLLAVGLCGEELARPDLVRLLRGGNGSKLSPRVRGHAALALGRLGSGEGISSLTGTLDDPEALVRPQAALSLAGIADPRAEAAVEKLTERLRQATPAGDRCCAAVALGEIGAAGSLDPLLAAYRDADPEVACHAALGLALLSRDTSSEEVRRRVRSLLLRQVRDQGSPTVRAALLIALAIAGERQAVPIATSLAEKSDDPVLTAHAAQAIGILGAGDSLALLRDLVLKGRHPRVKRDAAWALGLLADPVAVEDLLVTLQSDPREFGRGQVAVALGGFRCPAAADALVGLLGDRKASPAIRAFAAVGLGHLLEQRPPSVLAGIRHHLDHDLAGEILRELLIVL